MKERKERKKGRKEGRKEERKKRKEREFLKKKKVVQISHMILRINISRATR